MKTKGQNTLYFAFCVSDDYVKYITITIQSIAQNHKDCDVEIHIVCSELSENSNLRLDSLAGAHNNIRIIRHRGDDTRLEGLKLGRWSKYAWYRVLLSEILTDIDRVVYLDADTVVARNVSNLFDLTLDNRSVGGVMDIQAVNHSRRLGIDINKPYLCSGVLLINLEYWRKNNISNKILEWAKSNQSKLKLPDQDSINYICQDNSFYLPPYYGLNYDLYYNKDYCNENRDEIVESFYTPSIIHYMGGKDNQPWYNECPSPFVELWCRYNNQLRYPVKVKYYSKGFLKFRIVLWDLLHNRVKYHRRRFENVLKQNGII